MTKVAEPQFIETTADQVTAESARRGVAADCNVIITVEPDEQRAEVRRFARSRMIVRDWSDVEVDHIIEEERDAVQPHLG